MRSYPTGRKVVPDRHTHCFIVWQKNPFCRLDRSSVMSPKFIVRTNFIPINLLPAHFHVAIKGSSFFHYYPTRNPKKSRTWAQKWQLTANPNWDWLSGADYLMIATTCKNSFLLPTRAGFCNAGREVPSHNNNRFQTAIAPHNL